MAFHYSIPSMLQESLRELAAVAEYCVTYQKDLRTWGSHGCYGYPAAILLLSIADSIGSYVIGGDVKEHFDILSHPNYYNLSLDKESIDIIYKNYRCLLTHHSAMAFEATLGIGKENEPVFEITRGKPLLRLSPFLRITKEVVETFLKKADIIVPSSEGFKEIRKRSTL
ncbi:hypothetical protein ACFL5X_03210 [Candidatus Omnitrophota bacterium]